MVTPSLFGIDVSGDQHPGGAAIGYEQVARTKHFAAVKMSDGVSLPNPYAQGDVEGFLSAGMDVAVYHFLEPDISGVSQAAFAIAHRMGCSIILDNEPGLQNMTPAQAEPLIEDFLDVCVGEGVPVIDYLDLSWYEALDAGSLAVGIFLADPSDSEPSEPCVMWQYGTGAIPGIAAETDLDAWVGAFDDYLTFFRPSARAGDPIMEALCLVVK